MTAGPVCRVCGGSLWDIHDFKDIFLPDILLSHKTPILAPICISICDKCDLIQIKDPVDNVLLFSEREWYRRSLREDTVKMIEEAVRKVQIEKPVKYGDWVLDIGANDGTLLSKYPSGIRTFAVSPAKCFKDILENRCTRVASDFFTGNYGVKFKVITSLWTLTRTQDVNRFLSRINLSLDDDGLLVLQFYDIISLLQKHAVDTIRHEELIYPSTSWVVTLLKKHGLYVYDADEIEHESGCIRVFATKNKRGCSENLLKILRKEHDITDNLYTNLGIFETDVTDIFKVLRKYCKLRNGYVVGAFSRGSTLLQYLNLYSSVYFKKALEINPDKFGKVLAGTSIEVVPEEDGLRDFPEYLLILPWYIKEHFLNKYFKYMYAGGKVVIPLPTPEVCSFKTINGIGDIVCTPI